MNAKQRYRAARSAEYHAKKREQLAALRGEQEATGCSSRVINAIAGPSLRQKHTGSVCLPGVAIYQAGHRKSDNVTAR